MFPAMHEDMGAFDGACRICVKCQKMLPYTEFFVYRDTGKPRAACKPCTMQRNRENHHTRGYGLARKVRAYNAMLAAAQKGE